MLVYLLFASPARADGGEEIASDEIALDKLPQDATKAVKNVFQGADLIHARRVVKDGKVCFTVSIIYRGEVSELYVSLDGKVVTSKHEDFSFTKVPKTMLAYALVLMLPGAIAALVISLLVQTVVCRNKLSVMSNWFLMWLGSAVCICVILSVLPSLPRKKDLLVIALLCLVWGAIAASFVEVVCLTQRFIRGDRSASCRSIIMLCLLGLVVLSLSVPIDILRIQRMNQYYREPAMRSVAD
jgi:hypothetical protein